MKDFIFFSFSQIFVTCFFAFSLFGNVYIVSLFVIALCVLLYVYCFGIPRPFPADFILVIIPYYVICFFYVLLSSIKIFFMLLKGSLATYSVQAKQDTGSFFKSFFLMHGITSTPGTIFMTDSADSPCITFNKLSYKNNSECSSEEGDISSIKSITSLVDFIFGTKDNS